MTDIRDKIRSAVLAEQKPRSKNIVFFGQEIEIRQPTLKAILDAQQEDNRQIGVASMLINYAYVPGTDEKVFEDTDADQLLMLPFGENFVQVTKALEDLSDVNFLDTASGLKPIQPVLPSTD